MYYVSCPSSLRPTSAMRPFCFSTDGILRKLCVLDAITMKRLHGGYSNSPQPLWKHNRFVFVWSHKWIYIASTTIWSMFHPLLRWLLLLLNIIAFNEYDFLEKWPFIVGAFWLLIDWKKMRARSFSFSFQFSHWISRKQLGALCAADRLKVQVHWFRNGLEEISIFFNILSRDASTKMNELKLNIRKNWHRNGKCNRLRNNIDK